MSRFTKKRQIPTTFYDNQFPAGTVDSTLDSAPTPTFGSSSSIGRSTSSSKTSRGLAKSHEITQETFTSTPITAHLKSTMYKDEDSQEVLRKIDSSQKQPVRLKKILYEYGEEMQTIVRDKLTVDEDTPGYQKILDDFLFENENLIFIRGLRYRKLEFKDEKNEIHLKPTLSDGRLFITNSRLIFITAEQIKATTLSTFGNEIKGPGGYQVASYHNNEVHYQQLPMNCIRSLELHTRTGGRAEVNIDTKPGCAGGFFSKLTSLFSCATGCEFLNTKQQEGDSYSREYCERTLMMGVMMPPWMTKMMLIVHVPSEVPLPVLTSFVSLLQRNTTDIPASPDVISDLNKDSTKLQSQRNELMTPSPPEREEQLYDELMETPLAKRRDNNISNLRDIVRTLGQDSLPERLPDKGIDRTQQELRRFGTVQLRGEQSDHIGSYPGFRTVNGRPASEQLGQYGTIFGEPESTLPARRAMVQKRPSQRAAMAIERRPYSLTPKLSSLKGTKPSYFNVDDIEPDVLSNTIPPPPMFSPNASTTASIYEEPKSAIATPPPQLDIRPSISRTLSSKSPTRDTTNSVLRRYSDRSFLDIACGFYPENAGQSTSSADPYDEDEDDDDDDILDDDHIEQLYTPRKPEKEEKPQEEPPKEPPTISSNRPPVEENEVGQTGAFSWSVSGSGNVDGDIMKTTSSEQETLKKRRLFGLLKDESDLYSQNEMAELSDVTMDPHTITTLPMEIKPRSRTVSPNRRNIRCVCPRCLNGAVSQKEWHCMRSHGKDSLPPEVKMMKDGKCVCAHCMDDQVELINSVLRDHAEQFDEISLV